MTITPSGNPLWLRTVDVTQYGGNPNLKDHGGIAPVNSKTDLGAAQFARLTSDMAAVARQTILLRLAFIPGAAGADLVQHLVSAWGGPWAPKPPQPREALPGYVTLTGTGSSRTITIASSMTDDYGVPANVTPRIVQAIGGTWDGTITSNAFMLTGLTNGAPVSVTVW